MHRKEHDFVTGQQNIVENSVSNRRFRLSFVLGGVAATVIVAVAIFGSQAMASSAPVQMTESDLVRVAAARFQPFAGKSASKSPIMEGNWKAADEQMKMLDAAKKRVASDPRSTEFAVNSLKQGWGEETPTQKTVYLTIDDGPSSMTPKVLSILKENDVKATFFVTCQYPDSFHYVKEAYEDGHTIALHTGCHDYARVYASDAAYFADLAQVSKMVKEQIGYVPCFVRFPGGSSNTISRNYSKGIMSRLAEQLPLKGFQYYDWNASTGDGGTVDRQQAYENGIKGNGNEYVMLLCHDTPSKQSTADALPDIIKFYKEQGYTFAAIDRHTPVMHQGMGN